MLGVWEDGVVGDDGEAWMVEVEPVGDLPIGDQEHAPHPPSIQLQRPQGVPQLLSQEQLLSHSRISCYTVTAPVTQSRLLSHSHG